jgi:eukaryotic-like serine/threonine-protein kinase
VVERPRTPNRNNPTGATANGGADPLVGSVVGGDFLIRRVLARGGESVAYLALQESVGRREVVVKTPDEVSWRLLSRDRRREANPYHKEIRVTAMVRHPALPQFYSAGQLPDGRPWIAMEYIVGTTLSEQLRSGPLPLPLTVTCADELLSVLRTLHAASILYRDLKPNHLLLQLLADDDVRLRLLDLGHAQSTYQSDLPIRLGTGEPIGSPGYLSPELAEGRPADERSDLFSAALLVYEMLTGIPAIHLEDPRPDHLIAYVRSEQQPLPTHPLRTVRPELPEDLERILLRALDRRSRNRPETARAFRAELLPALRRAAAGPGASGAGMFGRLFRKGGR